METIKTDKVREIRKHAIEFERRLIADWLRYAVTEEIYNLIYSGDYRHYFAGGTLPNKDGEFFHPFERELP